MAGQARDLQMTAGCESPPIITARACLILLRPTGAASYRLDNVTLSPAGRVRVVLDWELCTLGDPLAAVVTATAGSSIMASRPPP